MTIPTRRHGARLLQALAVAAALAVLAACGGGPSDNHEGAPPNGMHCAPEPGAAALAARACTKIGGATS